MTVGIRPEDLVLADGQGIEVEVDLVEELGDSRVIYATLSGTDISVVVPPRTAIAEGAQIRLGLPADALHFFDSNTRKRQSTHKPGVSRRRPGSGLRS